MFNKSFCLWSGSSDELFSCREGGGVGLSLAMNKNDVVHEF